MSFGPWKQCPSLHDEHARKVLGIKEEVRCEMAEGHGGPHEGGGLRWATTFDRVMEFCGTCKRTNKEGGTNGPA